LAGPSEIVPLDVVSVVAPEQRVFDGSDGAALLVSEGARLGGPDGRSEVCGVALVGFSVGCSERPGEGAMVGTMLGAGEGSSVGAGVGDEVGENVRTSVTVKPPT
jgi:hypothetical protein